MFAFVFEPEKEGGDIMWYDWFKHTKITNVTNNILIQNFKVINLNYEN